MEEFNRNNTWFFVRNDVLKRDNYYCGMCTKRFKKKDLDVDHKIPVKDSGHLFDKENLWSLCKSCHKIKTKFDIKINLNQITEKE